MALIALFGGGFLGGVRGFGAARSETTRLVVRDLVVCAEWGDGINLDVVAAAAVVVGRLGFVETGPLKAVALVPSVD